MSLKNNIKNNFSKAAFKYSNSAIIQNIVAKDLASIAFGYIKDNDHVLDLGCGTGFLGDKILQKKDVKFFASDISAEMLNQVSDRQIKVHCDFEDLSFQNETFDIIVSSFALQWSLNLLHSLKEANRVLKSCSTLIFSIPLQGSLKNIKHLGVNSINNFHHSSSIIDSLKLANFEEIYFEEKNIKQNYKDPLSLLKNIKDLGANLAIDNNDNKNNLLSLRRFNNFEDSWNIGYFVCKKN